MQEEALDKTISLGAPEEYTCDVSMPSKHMLTWAQQIAQAAHSDSTSSTASHAKEKGRLSELPADSLQAHEQPVQPSNATAVGDRDPFAFDSSKFSVGGSAGEAQGQETGPSQPEQRAPLANSQADAYAFDMGAFGIASEPEPPSTAYIHPAQPTPDPEAPAAAPREAPAAAQDPYAFDMGAFGLGGPSAASAVAEAKSSAPAEAAHGQGSWTEGGQDVGPAKPATHADPYAFDMGAFGMAVDPSEQTDDRGTTTQDSAAQTSLAAAAEAEQPEKPASLADPYAFDLGAFGMAAHPPEQAAEGNLQASACKPEDLSSAAQQDESIAGPAAQTDPFAFDMGAFGMSGISASDGAAIEHSLVKNSQSSAAPPLETGMQTADAFAFDPGAFGMSMPDATAEQGADNENTSFPAAAQGSQQRSSAPSSVASTSIAERKGQPEGRGLAGVQQAQQQQREPQHPQQKQAASWAAAGGLALAPPEQEAFDPLTDAELQQLEGLLLRAAGLDNSRSGNGESAPLAYWLQGSVHILVCTPSVKPASSSVHCMDI